MKIPFHGDGGGSTRRKSWTESIAVYYLQIILEEEYVGASVLRSSTYHILMEQK
jgi:hypothetical protein